MNTNEIAAGLRKASEALWDIAAALDSAGPVRPVGPVAATPSAAPAGTFSDGTPIDEAEKWEDHARTSAELGDQGFDAICPKHRTPYKDGNYGPFCTQKSDDPAWANRRGYCNITPKNAATYLRNLAGTVTA